MPLKRLITMSVLTALCSGVLPLAAFAEDEENVEEVDADVEENYQGYSEVCSVDLTGVLDEATMVPAGEVYTTGQGSLTYWLKSDAQLNSGGGGNTVYMENGSGILNLGGSNTVYALSGAAVSNMGGSNLVYLQSGASFNADGSGSNVIYYEDYSDIEDAGGSPTLYKCGDILFSFREEQEQAGSQGDDQGDDDEISDEVDGETEGGDDDIEDALDDLDEAITEGEGEVVVTDEGTTVTSEEVSEDELSEEMQEDLEEASTSGAAPDQFYVAVMWGYFGEDKPNLTETTWDGTIFINNEAEEGVFSRPVKTLMFERQQDSIDFDNTTVNQTSFVSNIYNRTDGILFKVRTDLASNDPGKLSFATDYSTDVAAVYLEDLYNNGSAEFSYGAYKVVMKVLTREDWISAHSEHNSSDRPVPSDTEGGAWYLKYMNYSLDNNFFSGYKNEKGQLTGKIGPGDTLTRFETLKVLFQLSDKLNMGVAAGNCDPSTVTQSSSTDWMGTEWARGYVQCIEDSGVSVTLLTTIGSDTSVGQEPAQRWEVMASAFQMLGLDTDGAVESSLTDVDSSGLSEAFQSMLDKAVELGVISGYPDGTFKPYKTVNRAEMFKIVTLFYEVLSV